MYILLHEAEFSTVAPLMAPKSNLHNLASFSSSKKVFIKLRKCLQTYNNFSKKIITLLGRSKNFSLTGWQPW
jgi:hypothetical protein